MCSNPCFICGDYDECELVAKSKVKAYSDLSFFGKLIFRIKNRKFLKQLRQAVKNQIFLEKVPRLDESFNDTIQKMFSEDLQVTYGVSNAQ